MRPQFLTWLIGGALVGGKLVLGATPAMAQGGYGGMMGGNYGGMMGGDYSGMMGPGMMGPGMMGGYNSAAGAVQRAVLTIGDTGYTPSQLSVPAGTMVIWVNRDNDRHEIVVPNVWDSGVARPGGRRAAIFATPGTYDYHDPSHPDMHGQLTVAAQ